MKIVIETVDELNAFTRNSLETQYVKYLTLNDLGLTAIPGFVFELPFVEELILNNNFIGTIPREIVNLAHTLRVLQITNNQIKEIPAAVGSLGRLSELDLGHNVLDKISPQIGQCRLLHDLRLNDNKLQGDALPKEIGGLLGLDSVNLTNNTLSALPTEMGELKALQWLTLTSNKFSDIPTCIPNMTGLQHLLLLGNPIPKPICDAFRRSVKFIPDVQLP